MSVNTESLEKTNNDLIEQYQKTKDKKLRNLIVMQYTELVKYAVISTRNMYQKFAEPEDISNEAVIALIKAIDTFDLSKGAKFETYASIKMRGAIIDYIRKQDIIPRSVRHFAKDLETAYSHLNSTLDREPTLDDISEYMQIPKDKLMKNMASAAGATTMSFEDLLYENNFDMSSSDDSRGVWENEKGILLEERNTMLAKAVDTLNEQQRNVISLYYYEKLKFSEIAEVMDVSESRVCQIHSKAILKMKSFMDSYNNI